MMDEFEFSNLKVQGIKLNYLYICERKLWLFDRGITMEGNSDRVLQGKLLHEYSYPKEEIKEIMLDDIIRIDILSGNTIREVKYSNKMKEADRIQIYYYLFYLKQKGIEKKGSINYPKERRRETIELTDEAIAEVKNALKRISEILKLEKPPAIIKKPYCKKCSYYEFCWG